MLQPEYFWSDGNFDTFACGGCQGYCCPVTGETLSVQYDSSAYITSNGQMFTGGREFRSHPQVTSIDDVVDPQLLTPFQQSQSVRFVFTDRSDFVIGFGREGNGNRQQFAGHTNIGVDVC